MIPKVLHGVEVRALCRPVKFFHSFLDKTISIWTLLCAWGHYHTGKGLPQSVGEAQNCLECLCML
uniref:Uncharacterized protein n=1 Tax=Anguilla anguilla TaxID=7936 RepID=A0A0E9XXV6_ANGAN